MTDRLSYTEFRDEFLLAIAIAVKADTGKMINPIDVAANVEGRFQASWPQSAMTDLADSGLISGMTFLSDGGSYKLTGSGVEAAEDIASNLGGDLYEMIDEPQEEEPRPEGFVIGDPDAGYVIGEPANTRDLDQLKADLRIRLDILEAFLTDDRSLIGHNHPPEEIDPFRFSSDERSELLREISVLREQVEEPTPDRQAVFKSESVLWRATSKVAGWLGDRFNAQIDNAAWTFGAIVYGQQIGDALHAAANIVLEWLHMLPPV